MAIIPFSELPKDLASCGESPEENPGMPCGLYSNCTITWNPILDLLCFHCLGKHNNCTFTFLMCSRSEEQWAAEWLDASLTHSTHTRKEGASFALCIYLPYQPSLLNTITQEEKERWGGPPFLFGASFHVSDLKVESSGRLDTFQELQNRSKTSQFTLCPISIPLVKTKDICM